MKHYNSIKFLSGLRFVKNITVHVQEYNHAYEDKCSCNRSNGTAAKKYLYGTKVSHRLDSYEEMPQFSVSNLLNFMGKLELFPYFRHSYKDSEIIFLLRTLS